MQLSEEMNSKCHVIVTVSIVTEYIMFCIIRRVLPYSSNTCGSSLEVPEEVVHGFRDLFACDYDTGNVQLIVQQHDETETETFLTSYLSWGFGSGNSRNESAFLGFKIQFKNGQRFMWTFFWGGIGWIVFWVMREIA